jgi:hypothetical protein
MSTSVFLKLEHEHLLDAGASCENSHCVTASSRAKILQEEGTFR